MNFAKLPELLGGQRRCDAMSAQSPIAEVLPHGGEPLVWASSTRARSSQSMISLSGYRATKDL